VVGDHALDSGVRVVAVERAVAVRVGPAVDAHPLAARAAFVGEGGAVGAVVAGQDLAIAGVIVAPGGGEEEEQRGEEGARCSHGAMQCESHARRKQA